MDQLIFQVFIVFNSGISLIMGLYMIFLHRSSPRVKGPLYWSVGSLIIGAGLLFRLVSRDYLFLSAGLTPLLVTVGLYAYLAGIWSFKGKKINNWILVGMPLTDILQFLIFLLWIPSQRIRMGIHTIILLLYCSMAFYEMIILKKDQFYLRKLFNINAIAYFLYFLVLGLSLFSIVDNPEYSQLAFSKSIIVMMLISGLIMIALTFGFLSAVNLQLNKGLNEQLKSRTKFFTIIAHDLRGPVGNIVNFMKLLNNKESLSEAQRKEFFERIELLSRSTYHLLQNLLEWSSLDKQAYFEKEDINLNELVLSNLNFFRSNASIKSQTLNFTHNGNTYIRGNPGMIETILRNLVSNAVKYTPSKGNIHISTYQKKDRVFLEVLDDGYGIEAGKLKYLFEFDRITPGKGTDGETGSGIGLALCKEFVEKNQGSLHIESNVNEGTKVMIEFPVSEYV